MKTKLGKQEMQMLAYLQMRKRQIVKTGDLTSPLQISLVQERELFRRMARGGLIARVRPGLYLVPERLPIGGSWTPDEALALNTIMGDKEGRYQICGPNAFNRYGFNDQIPNRIYVYNNRISGERTVGAVALTLIKVADNRLGDTVEVETTDGQKIVYGSRVRTLVDAVYDWSRFNSLPCGYDWIRRELAAGRVAAKELAAVAQRYGDRGTIRRIGSLLETLEVDSALLRKLEKSLTASTATIPMIPSKIKRGRADLRWGVVRNDIA